VLAVALAVAAPPHLAAQDVVATVPVARGETPSRAQTEAALAAVRAEVAPTRKTRTLEWNGPTFGNDEPRTTPAWTEWLAGLFGWLAQTSRVAVWMAAGVLAALIAYYVVRLVREARLRAPRTRPSAPTHVHDLDIRPESLPADVGAEARALWASGARREALALLYRGLLSRLVHAHAVPIRDSSTEGEALALARPRLAAQRQAYVARLVGTWQRAVYGNEMPQTEMVGALCDEFAPLLDVPASAAPSAAR
jgi:hypothetical protein